MMIAILLLLIQERKGFYLSCILLFWLNGRYDLDQTGYNLALRGRVRLGRLKLFADFAGRAVQ